jgi:hypothetical protein
MEERKMERRKDAKRSVARSVEVELDWKGSGRMAIFVGR